MAANIFFFYYVTKVKNYFVLQIMHQNWNSTTSDSVGIMGSTALLTNAYELQQSSWFNQNHSQNIQIKSEPIDYNSDMNYRQATPPQQTTIQNMSPVTNQNTIDLLEPFRHLGTFNPLTPPGYSGLLFPSFLNNHQQQNKQSTPCKAQAQDLSSKSNKTNNETRHSEASSITPPMDVQTPPKSPTMDQTPEKDEHDLNGLETRSDSIESYDEDSDDYADDDGMLSDKVKNKRKGNNKPRQYKCKQCKEIFHAKTEFWDHTKSHIKPEKMLQCPKCPFVTEYKHHLEYHLRNHSRSKPFQCPHCNYSCVNKSMLNSHLKSHSTVFQYRCIDCNYATKYCHSLKLHLRKYSHKPDIVLNLDGTPNPLPIIDIYGTRRGPKSKSTTSKLLAEIEKNQQQQKALHHVQHHVQKSQLSPPLTPSNVSLPATMSTKNSITKTPPSSLLPNAAMMVNMLSNKMPLFPYLNLNFQMFAAQQQHQQNQQNNINSIADDDDLDQNESIGEADTNFMSDDMEKSPIKKQLAMKEKSSSRTKRKGKAFKFDEKFTMNDRNDGGDSDNESMIHDMPPFDNSSKVTSSSIIQANANSNVEKPFEKECKFCGIIFKDNVLFSLHVGYHSLGDDPFKCNMCGQKTDDKIQFFLHIAKFPHS